MWQRLTELWRLNISVCVCVCLCAPALLHKYYTAWGQSKETCKETKKTFYRKKENFCSEKKYTSKNFKNLCAKKILGNWITKITKKKAEWLHVRRKNTIVTRKLRRNRKRHNFTTSACHYAPQEYSVQCTVYTYGKFWRFPNVWKTEKFIRKAEGNEGSGETSFETSNDVTCFVKIYIFIIYTYTSKDVWAIWACFFCACLLNAFNRQFMWAYIREPSVRLKF